MRGWNINFHIPKCQWNRDSLLSGIVRFVPNWGFGTFGIPGQGVRLVAGPGFEPGP